MGFNKRSQDTFLEKPKETIYRPVARALIVSDLVSYVLCFSLWHNWYVLIVISRSLTKRVEHYRIFDSLSNDIELIVWFKLSH